MKRDIFNTTPSKFMIFSHFEDFHLDSVLAANKTTDKTQNICL